MWHHSCIANELYSVFYSLVPGVRGLLTPGYEAMYSSTCLVTTESGTAVQWTSKGA